MPRKIAAFYLCYQIWLGIVNLFQTFEDLESVKDKQADIEAARQMLDESERITRYLRFTGDIVVIRRKDVLFNK
jgi:hypothetical protein